MQKNEELGIFVEISRQKSPQRNTQKRGDSITNMSSILSQMDKDATEDEDSYATEILQRLDDLGVTIPPKHLAENAPKSQTFPAGIYKDSAALSVRDWTFNQNDRRG